MSQSLISPQLSQPCHWTSLAMRWPFVPRSSQLISFFSHCSIKACTHGEFEVFVVLIVPSRHMLWRSADRRCTILGTRFHSILGYNTHGNFEKSVKKSSRFKVGMSIQRRCICMAKSSVHPQTVQSKEVFNLTYFTVVMDG